ncbi:MAG: hypothetical protein HYR55_10355 [Acidobacteria bacterium]|nr:hypothetical protein [Acidobacteriota bacterium]MBI3658789.1 hypothetical protein [Acidobacteriota bacterium]
MSTDNYRIGKKLHLIIGMIGAVWLLFMSVTGILINHQEPLGLGDREISDRFLPTSYRADVRTGSTRWNVVLADLHSGRIFGRYGYMISDIIGGLLILSVLSGAFMYFFTKHLKTNHDQTEASGTANHLNASATSGVVSQNGKRWSGSIHAKRS